jgi:hypothetical protein
MLTLVAVEALFMADREGDLQSMMDTAYLETSRRVLDVLTGQYKFLDHLQALRRYLLLGQGDFIRHLMELLELAQLFLANNFLYCLRTDSELWKWKHNKSDHLFSIFDIVRILNFLFLSLNIAVRWLSLLHCI